MTTDTVHSPLEQFEIFQLSPERTASFVLNNQFATNDMVVLFFLFLFVVGFTKPFATRSGFLQDILESVSTFILEMLKNNLGRIGKHYLPFVSALMLYISIANVFGMLPYGYTITSQFVVTLSLSISTWILCVLVAVAAYGIFFGELFLPSGTPLFLSFFLVLVETISYFFRSISLGVRLFANMMSGHTLLKILSGFASKLYFSGGFWSLLGILTFTVIVLFTLLEVGIAFLQAYVFVVLTVIYLSDSVATH
jgi:ATP synthase subunit 6